MSFLEIDSRKGQYFCTTIIFEAPCDKPSLSLPYNKFSPDKKPVDLVFAHQKKLRRFAKTFPWVASDIGVYDNILQLWDEAYNVKLFHVDGPSELLQETIKQEWNKLAEPRRRGVHLPWWVYIYLRERIMADNIMKILPSLAQDTPVLVFLQKFHWLHVQYLLQKPCKQKIFQYYFAKFDVTQSTISKRVIGIKNPVLSKYWDKYSDFV